MAHRFSLKASTLLAALLVGSVTGSVALCQGPPPGGPGGPGGPPGFGRGPMGGPRQASAIHTPIAALTAGLKLTDDQKTQIESIQDQVKQQRDALMPRPGDGNDGPPDPETMRANFDKLRSMEAQANKQIAALLTDTQKAALPGLLKQIDNLRMAGIPVELYGTLHLTSDQHQKIAAIVKSARAAMASQGGPGGPGGGPDGGPGPGGPGGGPDGGPGGPGGPGGGPGRGPGGPGQQLTRKIHAQVMATLTAAQQQKVAAWMDAHPRPSFGGPGGPGGGPGGPDGDGPPPPPGGDGGAPPPPGE